MDNHFNTPSEIIELNMKASETKTTLPLGKMILLGIMAGMFIAFGAADKQYRRALHRKCRCFQSACRRDLPCRADADRLFGRRTIYRKLSDPFKCIRPTHVPLENAPQPRYRLFQQSVRRSFGRYFDRFFRKSQLFRRSARCIYDQSCHWKNFRLAASGTDFRYSLQYPCLSCRADVTFRKRHRRENMGDLLSDLRICSRRL